MALSLRLGSSRFYQTLIAKAEPHIPKRMRPAWESDAGPKTIFFWAPAMKWCLVLATLSDYGRPIEKVSLGQTFSIFLTGVLYSRYAMVIVPKNYTLFSCNLFVAISNGIQLGRIFHYRQGLAHQQEEQQEASKITTIMDGTSSVASVLAPVASNAVAAVASTASVAASTSIPKLALNVEL